MSIQSQTTDDADLLAALRKGDRDALAKVVEQHQGAIFGYLSARVFEPADAEDLCQEVFLRCYNGRVSFDRTTRIGPWLVGIARNLLREHIRRIQRRKEVTWVEFCLELESLAETQGSDHDEVLQHLPACLDSLGQSSRQALDMHYKQGMRLAEIGEFLRRTEGAVKLLMYRARQALRHCLDHKKTSSDDE
jgi:RNA polymerase sigma-70 factor (ECF subfamily)